MDAEQQLLLSGYDPVDLSSPAPESDELIDENPLSEGPPEGETPAGASTPADGDFSIGHGEILQEADSPGPREGDTGGSGPPVQASSGDESALEYQISSWAMLSPDMDPEQARLLEEDIERKGVAVPVDELDGEVLDGRHRESARRKTGRPPRYNFLPEDTDVLSHLLSRNGLRGRHDENERAIYAFKLWQHQFIAAGIEPGTGSANLRNFKSQEEIARFLHVSPRSVSSVASVLGPRSTACPELRDAVETGLVKASGAQRVLNKPAEIQRLAVAEVVGGQSRTVLSAASMVEREISLKGSRATGEWCPSTRTAAPSPCIRRQYPRCQP